MIKFFPHIHGSLIQKNQMFSHSARRLRLSKSDAEIEDSAFCQSTTKHKILNRFLPVYPERRRRTGMTKVMIKFFCYLNIIFEENQRSCPSDEAFLAKADRPLVKIQSEKIQLNYFDKAL
jgi:hypothetical protein